VGLMAVAGTWGAEGAFASQREVALERPCWLDEGSERARRGYLYGQLCCVGGCGRWGGRGAGLAARLSKVELGWGWYLAQVQPRL
jgi:hypothetical protein